MATAYILAFLLPHVLMTWTSALPSNESTPLTFKAAVYEHIPFMARYTRSGYTRKQALELMNKNLAVYRNQTVEAKRQGAQIIVFPEDGIYGLAQSRRSILPYLEKIPDPDTIQWSPCTDPYRFPNTEVQQALSCMAKESKIYLVANMGDLVPCLKYQDPKCPSEGRYQYNTDVAYGPDGRLLAKYHKRHLFYEYQFDTPEAKVVSFDTPFGRIGMMTCFDILFKDPAVPMVRDHNITTIAFPTAWFDGLPLLTAMGFQSAFARGQGINLLAANIHLPRRKFHGSGIYTPKGVSNFYYDNNPDSPGKLLVSTIQKVNNPSEEIEKENNFRKTNNQQTHSDEFHSLVFKDMFTFRLVTGSSGNVNVCQGKVCCSLNYKISITQGDLSLKTDIFALGAFDGLHKYKGQHYDQVCTLLKCADINNKSSCGSPTIYSFTKFESLSLTGSFETNYVYPEMIFTDEFGQLKMAECGMSTKDCSWTFNNKSMHASGPFMDTALLSATLFGRDYSRDGNGFQG
uniref:Symplectin/biotinidase-like protein 2 n=1 Tax=Phylliroe bucephala TaxID=1903125 RepID=A0A2Z5EQ51_9GAST|nr:symplectin/biotinidase-like protein 2 [Phylliroe bucephala]